MTKPEKTLNKKSTGKAARLQHILDAAEACIERFGITKTTMDDVTEASGLGRMTIYRVFRTRSDLLNALAVRRLEALANEIIPVLKTYATFEESIVNGSLLSFDKAREDSLLFSLIEYTTDKSIERLLIDFGTPIDDLMIKVWGGVFSQARQKGILRSNVSDADLINWLRSIHLVLYVRDDLDRAGRARLLRTFVMPSFVG